MFNGPSAPAADAYAITPDDDNDVPNGKARYLRCKPSGTGGTLRVTTFAGTVFDTEIAAGETLPLSVSRVHATGTAATDLEGYV